jgi:hypothetical protein
MDFLGGFRVTVNMQDPQSVDKVAPARALDPRHDRADGLRARGPRPGRLRSGYRRFIIQCKLSATRKRSRRGGTGEKEIKDKLAGILQKDLIQLSASEDGSSATGEILFERFHAPADVQAAPRKAC